MFLKCNSLRAELCCTTFTFIVIQLSNSYVISHKTTEVPGLYDGFRKVKILNTSNFETEVFEKQKQKLWLVEFYKHWCGDCIRFVPTLKALAIDIFEWRDYVGIGVVDCANPSNNKLCRKLGVRKVPSLKIFQPNSVKNVSGVDYGEEGNVTYIAVREKLAQTLKSYDNNRDAVVYGSVNLQLLKNCFLERLWEGFPREVKYLLLVLENKESLVGSQVALDLSRTPEVRVRLVDQNNKPLYRLVGMEQGATGAVVLGRDSQPPQQRATAAEESCPLHVHFSPLQVANYTREGLNTAIRKYLRRRGVNITLHLPVVPTISTNVTIKEINEAARWERELKKALNVTDLTVVVFQMDLEAAISYVFKQEVSLTTTIVGKPLNALRSFVEVVLKYFPTGKRGKRFFKALKEKGLDNKSSIRGKDLQETFIELERKYKPFMPKLEWVGCRGTIPMFRGYPCSMWSLMHTLVTSEELRYRNNPDEQPEALNAIVGYIKYFFSCKVCSKHFVNAAQTIAGNVTSPRDAVLWLWKTHNNVDRRLAGDATEDPRHHKVQFPTRVACPSCYGSGGSWDESRVLAFLSGMYTNPVHLDPHHLPGYPTTKFSFMIKYNFQASLQVQKLLFYQMAATDHITPQSVAGPEQ